MEYVIIVVLIIVLCVIAAKYFLLKKEIKSITKQLDDENTELVTVQFVDDDVSEVVLKINNCLDKIQQTIIQEKIASATLKSSIINISHDMKTPLTSVIGYLQLVEKEILETNVKEMVKICLERTQYCNSLINDFFELSMIEASKYRVNLEKIDIVGELCEQILAHYPSFNGKSITPYLANADKPVIALVDKMMIQRVMQNLISNAIKYSSSDVYFAVEEREEAIITVRNLMVGEIDTERIFEKFYIQDSSRYNGCGVGLYLCKQFVESMQGKICASMQDGWLEMEIRLVKG